MRSIKLKLSAMVGGGVVLVLVLRVEVLACDCKGIKKAGLI
jgi:hypothetical protein